MSAKLLFGSTLLIALWVLLFVGFHIGGVVHMLLAIGIIGLVFRQVYKNANSK